MAHLRQAARPGPAQLRIAIATDWFTPRRGGIESQLLGLASGLGRRGHHVDVLTPMPRVMDGDHFRVRPLRIGTVPVFDLAIAPSLMSVVRRELQHGYDAVHAHVSVVSPVGYAAAIAARSLDLPTVVTFHSVLRHKKVLLAVANALFRLNDSAVIWSGVSPLVARQASAALGDADVRVLPNGTDLAFWREAATAGRPANADRVRIVSAMRLHRKKRPRRLLRAFVEGAMAARVPATLMLAGTGPERAALERDARALTRGNGAVRIEVIDWQDALTLRAMYATADGFATASDRESFGIAALEARAAGLPVIAMRAAGSSEFLEDGANAMLVDGQEGLAEAFRRFIADASLRARLAAGAVSLERYDWSAVLLQQEGAYGAAMSRADRDRKCRPVATA